MHTVITYLNLGIYAPFAALLIAAAVIDARKRIIPNSIVIALFALWLIGSIATTIALWVANVPLPDALAAPREFLSLSLLESITAALLFGLGSLLVATVFERATGRIALGGGDIKLLFVIGLFLGIEREAIALLVACVAFITVTPLSAFVLAKLRVAAPFSDNDPSPLHVTSHDTLHDPFPFGPFLALGSILALIV